MKGLSLWNPWAFLVACGEKRIETRPWGTLYRGPIAIHATKAFPEDAQAECFFEPFRTILLAHGIRLPADLPRGLIVAVGQLADCRSTGPYEGPSAPWVNDLSHQERAFGDFGWGRFGWFLQDVRRLPEPIPCRGAQGLWNVPADVLEKIEERETTDQPAPASPIIVDALEVWGGSYRGDQAAQAQRVGARNGDRWCHLSSTPDDVDFAQLHAFAARIGMKRSWWQGDHYDLTPGRCAAAVRAGAIEVTRLEMSMVLLYDRKGRERPSYGTPDKTARPVADRQLSMEETANA